MFSITKEANPELKEIVNFESFLERFLLKT